MPSSLDTLSVYSELVGQVARLRSEAEDLKREALCAHSLELPPEDEDDEDGGRGHKAFPVTSASLSDVSQKLQSDKKQLAMRATQMRLESAERERQSLLEFLQGDMGNTSVLARRLELLEEELRLSKEAEALAQQRVRESEQVTKQSRSIVEGQDQQIVGLQRVLDQLQVDVDLLRKERATHEQAAASLGEEVAALRQQLRAANEQLGLTQPRLQQVEPELLRLRRAQSDSTIERAQLLEELDRLTPLARLLAEVEAEFAAKTYVSVEAVPGVASWSAAPELRRLAPRLYDYLRQLSQQLYRKEAETVEAQEARDRALRDWQAFRAAADDKALELHLGVERRQAALEELQHRLSVFEQEFPPAKRAQAALVQVRAALSSFPGGLKNLFEVTGLVGAGDSQSGSSSSSSSSGGGGGGGGSGTVGGREERAHGYTLGFDSKRGKGPGARVTPASAPAPASASASAPKLSADSLQDEQLAVVVSRALTYNQSAVESLREAKAQLQQKDEAVARLREELHKATRSSHARKEAVDELQASLNNLSVSRSQQEQRLQASLEAAAELVENQNMFALVLEAKLTESQASAQTLTKQLQAATQDLGVVQGRVWRALREGGHQPPHADAPLPELLDFAAALLVSSQGLGGQGQEGQRQGQGLGMSSLRGALESGSTFSEMRRQLHARPQSERSPLPSPLPSHSPASASSSHRQPASLPLYGETSIFLSSPSASASASAVSPPPRQQQHQQQHQQARQFQASRAAGAGGLYTQPRPLAGSDLVGDVLTPMPPPHPVRATAEEASSAFKSRLREASLALQSMRE